MLLVGMVGPALILCVAIAYMVLGWRFFQIKSKLPVLGLRGTLGWAKGAWRKLAVCGALFVAIYFSAQTAAGCWSPDMMMVFNYEEAARGQNPNVTRFNESNILSDHVLEQVIQRGQLQISVDQLSGLLALSTPLDAEKLDVTQESDLKISTEYRVSCSPRAALYHTDPKMVLNLLADVYWEDFVHNYAENDSILDLSFEGLEGLEYLDVKDYLQMQAYKLANYLPHYSNESSSFRAQESGESFASLSQKIQNFVDIELERYEAFVLENGLSKDKATYQSRMQYANRLLETEKRKEMAAHDVRIEAIDLYNAFMTRFVLIPTYDENKEFYMSRTKVGVDYFADEAKEHLASATELGEEIEHNAYASAQIGGKGVTPNASAQADQRIEELKEELARLSAQSRELCSTYVKEKRDGYIQVCFTAPDMVNIAAGAVLLTGPAFGFIPAYGGTGAPLPDSPGVFCGCMGAGPGGNQRGAAGRHNGHSTAAVRACGRRNPISVRFQGGMVLPGRNVRRQFGRHSPGGLRRGPGGVSRRVLYHAGYIHFRNRALNGTAGNP